MNFASLVFVGLIIYIILVSLIIIFIHGATRKVRPKIEESRKEETLRKDNRIRNGGNANGNKKRKE